MDNNPKKNKDLNYLLEENIIQKSKTFGNNYNDTIPSFYIEEMDIEKDIYFLSIEKIIFLIGINENNKSLIGIDIHYNNILTNKKYICKSKYIEENLIKEKYEFNLEENDYIKSFTIIYGRYYIIRSIKIKTKNGNNFTLPDFIVSKSIKPDIYHAINEVNPDIKNNAIVNLFYGSGIIIHNIGCEYINENFYKKIMRVRYFMNIKAFKKKYKNYELKNIIDTIKKDIAELNNVSIGYDEGKYKKNFIKFFFLIFS